MTQIYHPGEIKVQQLAGEEMIAERNGKIVKDAIIKGAINFIEKQPMVIIGSTDDNGDLWISMLIGDFGFINVPEPNQIIIDTDKVYSTSEDVLYQNIKENQQIGLLFIELSTRRRFRVNGTSALNQGRICINVEEAYPNCPKYIQRRVISTPENFNETKAETTIGTILGQEEISWIQNADTFFVSSSSLEGRIDASHRGGPKGFIRMNEKDQLRIPDYAGNSMFNTLGNIVENPNVGLLFIDFENKKTLQLTGKAEIQFFQNSKIDMEESTGTGRYWLFKVDRWIKTYHHHDIAWEFMDYSPFNP